MIEIIFEDSDLVVINKPYGLECQYQIPQLLQQQLCCAVYPVHRLDTIVCGLMVYGKNKETADALSKQIANKKLVKQYLIIIEGQPEFDQARLIDLLFHDKQKNKTYVVNRKRKGVKEAVLDYQLLTSVNDKSLLAVTLLTGRTHQIRVQFASRNHPLVADGKYGSKINGQIALFCFHLKFLHPVKNEYLDLKTLPDKNSQFAEFNDYIMEAL
ncbi:MAG: RluA family pseudouridine synthase [Erysipelotrichaceae bacterium]